MSRPYTHEQQVAFFWRSVNKNGHLSSYDGCPCWEWTASVNAGKGYGKIRVGKHQMKAHRFSWMIHHGDPGLDLVLHHCDNPRCVNPAHLFLGNYKDNMIDKVRKNRCNVPFGEQHHWHKLTASEVLEIHSRTIGIFSATALAREYCVDRKTITRIAKGLTWRKVLAAAMETRNAS